MNRLLINEHPLQVLPTLATKIGLNEAIILQQVHYWNDINKKAKNNFKDGHYWTFNSYEEWSKQFPFWSSRTIQRTIKRLEDLKLIVVGNYNKLQIDRTKWYRIDYMVLKELETSPFGHIGTTNMTKWLNHLDNVGLPLPETNTEINSETSPLHNSTNCEQMTSPYDLDNRYMEVYLLALDRYGLKKHKRIRDINLSYLLECLEIISGEVNIFDWQEHIYKYLAELPSGNDGDILAFLRTVKRTLDVDLDDAIDRPNW